MYYANHGSPGKTSTSASAEAGTRGPVIPSPTKSKKNKVKRPCNAFFLWSRAQRNKDKEGKNEYSKFHSSEVSRKLGEVWRALPEEEKQVWYEKAAEEKELHLQRNPDYKYQPVRRYRAAHSDQDLGPSPLPSYNTGLGGIFKRESFSSAGEDDMFLQLNGESESFEALRSPSQYEYSPSGSSYQLYSPPTTVPNDPRRFSSHHDLRIGRDMLDIREVGDFAEFGDPRLQQNPREYGSFDARSAPLPPPGRLPSDAYIDRGFSSDEFLPSSSTQQGRPVFTNPPLQSFDPRQVPFSDTPSFVDNGSKVDDFISYLAANGYLAHEQPRSSQSGNQRFGI
eukprot:Colp12_sorted_trinity150504_noHs@6817